MPTHTARSQQPATLADEMAYSALPEETREMIERLYGDRDATAGQNGYNEGYTEGYRAGRDAGREEGQAEGYTTGYEAAIEAARTSLETLKPAA